MAIQKKHGKGRLDKWYKLAKEKGYRARASFKLIQLNKKYGFLEKSRVLLDLCAAPGSWCQVAAEVMPAGSLIVGVDLVAIKPIPRVITFQSDITTDKCRATIRQHFKTWKADTVLHDGAPNVGTAWVQDSFNQAELALQAMKLATEFLVEGGTFVTKVFRSKDYNPLLWVLNQLFTKVEATKPPSSRNVSAEIFVVCRGYKAPKRMDPRFLDPKYVFAELSGATPNNEAKVFNPEVKKRKREGYEEGDHTQFKEVSASDFIQCTDPIAILGSSNKLTFEQASNGDVALAVLARLPETTEDIKNCCLDLKVLGRKEFKLLLKWRLRVRDILGFTTSKTTNIGDIAEDVVEIEPMDDELKIQEELQNLKDKESGKRKRERRKENERKQRDIIRMQLNMVAPMDIGMEESGPIGEGSMFTLKKVEDGNAMRRLNRGKMLKTPQVDAAKEQDSGLGSSAADTEDVSDEEEDRLDRELDSMYNAYTERKSELDAKYRAKKARGENRDEEWDGLSADGKSEEGNSSDQLDEEEDDDDDDIFADETDAVSGKVLHTALNGPNVGRDGLSKRATNFFDQDIFKGIGELEPKVLEEDEGLNAALSLASTAIVTTVKVKTAKKSSETSSSAKKSSPDLVKTTITKTLADVEVLPEEEDWESVARPPADDQPDIDIITAEAMTLAHQLATGQVTAHDTVDDGFNKRAFRDRDGLPDWFLDDESKHDRPQKPITKAAATAIKEKVRAFNARPIKKVREAKARKKFKEAQKMEKLKKKSEFLANDEGMTEKEKADSISRLLSKAARKKPQQKTRVVVAKGMNKGIQGRPSGVKGRYRIVDARQKKELRAAKRIAQGKKKRR